MEQHKIVRRISSYARISLQCALYYLFLALFYLLLCDFSTHYYKIKVGEFCKTRETCEKYVIAAKTVRREANKQEKKLKKQSKKVDQALFSYRDKTSSSLFVRSFARIVATALSLRA